MIGKPPYSVQGFIHTVTTVGGHFARRIHDSRRYWTHYGARQAGIANGLRGKSLKIVAAHKYSSNGR